MILLLLPLLFSTPPVEPPVIPIPSSFEFRAGHWKPDARLKAIIADPANANYQELRRHGVAMSIVHGVAESYRLDVDSKGARIVGADSAGLFYALQTLRQLVEAGSAVRAIHIEDAPRFPYRGMHLDVARHFEPIDVVKRYIDLMSRFKLNAFHWHLTDDQGWRIEIKKYPLLTTVGGCRKETMVAKNFNPYVGDGTPHCGFYTQDQIRDVVAYAHSRHVNVIPEIEMPGHAKAALAAYPQLACTPGPFDVRTTWGVEDDIFCPKEETFQFIDGVLTEVAALFPSRYIHIGGDEVPKKRWNESPVAQDFMKREGLASAEELQSWFVRRVEQIVSAKGKQIIGWDEILEGGLAPQATVMSWRGTSGGTAAARANHDVIMSPGGYMYFDAYQGDAKQEPLAIGGFLPLERVYEFEPVPDSLTSEQPRHILGPQANLWSEYLSTPAQLEYMAYPRALALSEVAWSSKTSRSWLGFEKRLPYALGSLDKLHVNYRLPDVEGLDGDRLSLSSTAMVRLATSVPGATIHYTVDGKEPSSASTVYTKPITLHLANAPVRLQARAIARNGRSTSISSATFAHAALTPAANVDQAKLMPGLNYTYHELQTQFVAALDTARVVRSAVVNSIERRGDERAENYGLVFSGFLRAPADDVYEFSLTSDDASTLSIDRKVVVDNDDYHGSVEKRGMTALAKGLHPVKVRYAQAGGGAALSIRVRRNGGKWDPVPSEWMVH